MARVKKTIAQDDDIGSVSAQSSFLITKATVWLSLEDNVGWCLPYLHPQEIFIRHLAEKAFTAGKAETRTKKSLMYRDIGLNLEISVRGKFTDIPSKYCDTDG